MKKKSEPIVFFGNERLATGITTSAPTLQALIKAGYTVAAVVSNYQAGQSRKARDLEIQTIANKYNIPVLLPSKLDEAAQQLKKYQARVGILVAYGQIVPQSIIDIFPLGIINIHPSLLPLHRGPIPIESVILEGANKTGVSIMSLVRAMDAGPVYGQSEVTLKGQETKQQLADTLLDIGGTMLLELLPNIFSGMAVASPQDNSRATYDKLLSKKDGQLDWSKPAQQLEREIRAFLEWPRSYATIAGKEVIITQAAVVAGTGTPGTIKVEDKELLISCGGQTLRIEKLKPAGKQEMSAQAFLAGYGHLL